MQYDTVQYNIAKLYVYIVYILQLSCVFTSRCEAVCILDSDAISKPRDWCMLFEHRLEIRKAVRSDVVGFPVTEHSL